MSNINGRLRKNKQPNQCVDESSAGTVGDTSPMLGTNRPQARVEGYKITFIKAPQAPASLCVVTIS